MRIAARAPSRYRRYPQPEKDFRIRRWTNGRKIPTFAA
jgi:hypothetical protein